MIDKQYFTNLLADLKSNGSIVFSTTLSVSEEISPKPFGTVPIILKTLLIGVQMII